MEFQQLEIFLKLKRGSSKQASVSYSLSPKNDIVDQWVQISGSPHVRSII
jgi:hypothetical protein